MLFVLLSCFGDILEQACNKATLSPASKQDQAQLETAARSGLVAGSLSLQAAKPHVALQTTAQSNANMHACFCRLQNPDTHPVLSIPTCTRQSQGARVHLASRVACPYQAQCFSASSDCMRWRAITQLHLHADVRAYSQDYASCGGQGPRKVPHGRRRDAQTVIGLLEKAYGDGIVRDNGGAMVSSDPEDRLQAGEYSFPLLSPPQGGTHSLVLAHAAQHKPFLARAAECTKPTFHAPQPGATRT